MLTPGTTIHIEPAGQIEIIGPLSADPQSPHNGGGQRKGGEAELFKGINEHAQLVAVKLYSDGTPANMVQSRVNWLLDQDLRSRSPLMLTPIGSFVENGRVGEVSLLFESAVPLFELLYPGDPVEHLPLTDRVQIGVLLAQAISSLERQQMAHGDISTNNVLLRRRSDGSWKLKLIDFTKSFVPPPGASLPPSDIQGTRPYLPPEVNKEGVKRKDVMSDRFALAANQMELLSHHPFHNLAGNELDAAMAKPWKPPRGNTSGSLYPVKVLGPALIEMFRRGLNPKRNNRPTAEEWRNALLIAAHSMTFCPKCSSLMIANPDRRRCINCRKAFPVLRLVTSSGVTLPLDQPVLVIGREILNANAHVSRNHAIVRRLGAGEYFVEPAPGAGKTMIANGNGWERLDGIRAVAAGTCVRFVDIDAVLEAV